jgi:uncharacterized damage-inducible protein DinB
MNIQDIRFLYDYNYWANGKILAAASKITEEQFITLAEFPFGSSRSGSLRSTLLHIVDAECSWRGFFEAKKFHEDLNPDDFLTFELLETKFRQEEKSMRVCLERLTDEDLNNHIRYVNDEGTLRNPVLWHCLQHVVNHGAQHRSEAAALLTRYNASPGDLDFMVFTLKAATLK